HLPQCAHAPPRAIGAVSCALSPDRRRVQQRARLIRALGHGALLALLTPPWLRRAAAAPGHRAREVAVAAGDRGHRAEYDGGSFSNSTACDRSSCPLFADARCASEMANSL